MHLNDFSLSYFGSNGIVGSALGIAMGAALTAKLQHTTQVCVGFFGDGGANTGRTWEFVNFAAMQKLPLIAICENNQYAVETYVGRTTSAKSIADRAAGFGLPSVQVDGQDVSAVYKATAEERESGQQTVADLRSSRRSPTAITVTKPTRSSTTGRPTSSSTGAGREIRSSG